MPVRGVDGEELGSVADIYRVGEIDVYVVRGGARGEFDVPAVRDFVRIFAPGAARSSSTSRPSSSVRPSRRSRLVRRGPGRVAGTPARVGSEPDGGSERRAVGRPGRRPSPTAADADGLRRTRR